MRLTEAHKGRMRAVLPEQKGGQGTAIPDALLSMCRRLSQAI
jgi:hypothetical protein